MSKRWRSALLAGVFVVGSLVGAGGHRQTLAAQQPETISPEAMAQIAALLSDKANRTPTERKIDSQLIFELRMSRGQAAAQGVPALETDVPYTADDRAVLDVSGTIDDELLASLRALGAEIQSTSSDIARVAVDLDAVEAIAALDKVTFVQPKQEAVTSRIGPTPGVAQRRLQRDLMRRAALTAFMRGAAQGPADAAAGTGQGSVSSEGDVAHRAFAARGAFGTNGAGIKIGVLSDGVTNLAAAQASGDLPAVTVLAGQAGSGDEGTAMLEIVHDLVPGAQLYFATAFGGIVSFANNIRALRAAGCDIIVDDVFYFVETPFQDGQSPGVIANTNGGVVIEAVNDVTADGALYFSSAGNSGNRNDNQSGVWEGDFVDGGAVVAPILAIEGPAARLHSFGTQTFNTLTVAGANVDNLHWSDPLGGSANDYDLFRLNAAGTTVLAASINNQNGTQDPYEQVSAGAAGNRLVIVRFSGAARHLHLNTHRGRLQIATAGQTHGHSHALNAFSTAAVAASQGFPNGFNATNTVETFSSDGPRRIFYEANGAPKTPGNLLGTGGIVRQKPDIAAADGVSVTGVGGFGSPFFGTSAAAPHAAAIAALLKSKTPGLTPAQVRHLLTTTSIDIETPGVDRDAGAGIVMPVAALLASGATGTAFFAIQSAVAAENPGNGNGVVNGGEGARLAIVLQNLGVQGATGVSGALASGSPSITMTTPATASYPNLPALTGSGAGSSPYLFTLASNAPCPLTGNFTLNVVHDGGSQAIPLELALGANGFTVVTSLDGTAPAASPLYTATTGSQAGRVFRDGVASTCATPKLAFPGFAAETPPLQPRRFDAFAFNVCAEATPSCATVNVQGTNAINLFSTTYSPTFTPANIGTNYRADAGASAANRSYQVNASPGNPLSVVVADVPINVTAAVPYQLTVSGACAGGCATPNQVPVAKAKNVTVSAGADCTANASIDDGSFDADGQPLTITQSPAGPYPLGTTTVLLTVTDPFGATSQATATVTVVDTTPPTVSAFAIVAPAMWPPDHTMKDIIVNYNVADACTPGGTCVLSVTSNEPLNGTGDGDTSPDWEIVDGHRLKLRAERAGLGNGRIYTITLTCTDGAGNQTVKTGTVTVPKAL